MKIKRLLLMIAMGLSLGPIWAGQPSEPTRSDVRADLVRVEKSARKLHLINEGQVFRTYAIALGPNPTGHKQQEGDGRTPEGGYVIDRRNPKSRFHLSLHVSYPNEADRRAAAQRGVSPGGDIMIHGLPNGQSAVGKSHVANDWTAGCVAVTNSEIEEIWRSVANGTPIEILP